MSTEPLVMAPAPTATAERVHDRLVTAAVLFAVAVVIHNGDHVRRGADVVDAEVFWLGTAAIALEVALVVIICQRHRLAPLAAASTGFTLAAGYVVVHFLPEREWFSDPLIGEGRVDGWSIAAASIEVAAALALGIVGLQAIRGLGGLASANQPTGEQRSPRAGLLHPVALAFAASQVVVVVISFAQL